MQSNFQILQSQALMVFICMHWAVFNTFFNGEKMFLPFRSDLFKCLLGAPWTLLKSFSHMVFYLYFMFVHIVSHILLSGFVL